MSNICYIIHKYVKSDSGHTNSAQFLQKKDERNLYMQPKRIKCALPIIIFINLPMASW